MCSEGSVLFRNISYNLTAIKHANYASRQLTEGIVPTETESKFLCNQEKSDDRILKDNRTFSGF